MISNIEMIVYIYSIIESIIAN
uniref:Uncharacterized protein n=1 Tax=Escherichia coli TaxID=562 RepID=A0A2P9EDC6_ECOLX|nr:protein of unknown function [Escherichia coli]